MRITEDISFKFTKLESLVFMSLGLWVSFVQLNHLHWHKNGMNFPIVKCASHGRVLDPRTVQA